jgi:small-conductance mechanosensitive channel
MPRYAFLVVAVVLAGLLHWTARRGAAALRRRALRRPNDESALRIAYFLELLLSAAAFTGWAGAGWLLAGEFEALRMLRELIASALSLALTMPSITIGERTYAVLELLELPAALATLWVAASALTRLLRLRLKRLDRGAQDRVLMVVRYGLVCLGALLLLRLWGLDVSSLAIAASVIGVGIGFGLQNLASNFVSGLVIGFERPVQAGDFVQVGEWTGTVERIGPRHTEIKTLDNVSILVPNSRFLDNEVVNWSHGDPVYRLHVPIGVAYGSDVTAVHAALLAVAADHPAVLKDPRPRVEFRRFADSALEFELHVWARDPRLQFRLLSDLNFRIEAILRREGIRIPFPQHDIHLRSPQIDKLLHAWARRTFSAEEAEGLSGASADAGDRVPMFMDEAAPRAWSEDELDALVRQMRGADGVSIADRRHLLRAHPHCFVGREAVDWLVRERGLSRDEAVELGRLLAARGVIHHVLDEHEFEDDNLFYRFRCDEAA